MPKSSTKTSRRTSRTDLLPYPDFPLSPHPATGRWYKSIKGVRHYFGKLDDWKAALERYTAERDYWQAGRVPPPAGAEGLRVADLCNRFLTDMKNRSAAGEITARSFGEMYDVCELIVETMGKGRLVSDLTPDDFGKVREKLAARKPKGKSVKKSPWVLRNDIIRARSVFKYAWVNSLIDRPVTYGTKFSVPSKRELRVHKAMKGDLSFTAAEVRALVDAAEIPLKAMILLGINAGMKNTDCSAVDRRFINLDTGVIAFPRPKSGIDRRAVLWPETIKALREAEAMRPDHVEREDAGAVFLTRFGRRWVRTSPEADKAGVGDGGTDAIGLEFRKLCKAVGVRGGLGFSSLRVTFRTIADEVRDVPALNLIMGHVDDSMGSRYTQRIEQHRLKAVSDHVHAWLHAPPVKPAAEATSTPAKGGKKGK